MANQTASFKVSLDSPWMPRQ